MNVVVETSHDRRNAIITLLAGIYVLPLNHGLKLLRDQEIAAGHVESICRELVKSRRHSIDHARMNVLLKKLSKKINPRQPEPSVAPPCSSLMGAGKHERRGAPRDASGGDGLILLASFF